MDKVLVLDNKIDTVLMMKLNK